MQTDPIDYIYFITEGSVAFMMGDDHECAFVEVGPGNMFGETDLLGIGLIYGKKR